MSPPQPTLEAIARAVGVTDATVSRVLTGAYTAKRADALRRAARIRKVAAEMGYRPSVAARAIRTGRTGFIGMVRSSTLACSVHEPMFDTTLTDALHRRGLCLLTDVLDDGGDAPRIVREDGVDGLLINYAMGTPAPVRRVLSRCQLPAIWINRKRETNCVRPADEGAAIEATQELIRHGHRRIAYLPSPTTPVMEANPHYSTLDREGGYRRTMEAAGLQPLRLATIRQPDAMGNTPAITSFIDLLRQPDRPTAILAATYGRALLAAAWKIGLRVPEDLSVMTFDNHAAADLEMAVDRLVVPYRAMAEAAVAEVLALIQGSARQRPAVVLPFEFQRTGTVGPPA